MKKIIGLMVLALMVFLPMNTRAASGINYTCGQRDADGITTCTVTYNITDDDVVDSMTVTLTEKGGAEVTDINSDSNPEWEVSSKNEDNNVWTVILASSGVNGEGDLFTFKYKASGEADCGIEIGFNGQNIGTPTPEPDPTPTDTPTDNKQTGATLPYVALGVIVVVATGAYLATRNKSKMYRI